jgi:hypothetical protein
VPSKSDRKISTLTEHRRGGIVRLIVWWLGIAVVASIIAASLIDIAYSRFVYYFIVMPIGGVLLFPAAYAANRWLTPAIRSWLKRS